MNAETDPPRPGAWVQVWGQVVGGGRPEDLVVRLESKSEQYQAVVRRTHVVVAETLPDFATQCTRMHQVKPNRFVRCTLHDGHDEAEGHLGPRAETWPSAATSGYFEEA